MGDPEVVARSLSQNLSPRRSLVVPVQVVATPLGVPVQVVGLMVPLTGLPVPLTGIMEADDHYGMMTSHRGMEVIRHGIVEVEGGVEAIPPPQVLPPVSPSPRSLLLLLILGARLHMLPSSPAHTPRRRSLVQATLVVATLGVLVAGVMMDTLGMVVIGVVVIVGNLVHSTVTMMTKQVTPLSVRRFLLLLLLVLPATGRRRYVNVVSLVCRKCFLLFLSSSNNSSFNFNSSTSPEMQGWNVPIPT